MKIRVLLPAFLFHTTLLAAYSSTSAEEYSFDLSKFEKSPFEYGGYLEARWEHFSLDQDSTLYQLNFADQDQRKNLDRYTGILQLYGRYSKDDFNLYARMNNEAFSDDLDRDNQLDIHESYLSWQASPRFTLDLGKKLSKWGKGYAWNPVGFIERPKDPNEPDLAREGFTVVSADMIYSLQGALKTIAITPVLLPVSEDLNTDYGKPDYTNLAGKVYLLYKDTDIDWMFLSNGSRTARSGLDFSRNLSSNFEIHGEWAYVNDAARISISSDGDINRHRQDSQVWLLGFRYLTEIDTTYIIELYHNGAGYREKDTYRYYQLVENAIDSSDNNALMQARSLAKTSFAKQTIMRNYLYMRIAQKEPFDILYITPALTAIINLEDQSYSLSPEIVYTGITNLELRYKLSLIAGERYTEFGEKQNNGKMELRLQYHF